MTYCVTMEQVEEAISKHCDGEDCDDGCPFCAIHAELDVKSEDHEQALAAERMAHASTKAGADWASDELQGCKAQLEYAQRSVAELEIELAAERERADGLQSELTVSRAETAFFKKSLEIVEAKLRRMSDG